MFSNLSFEISENLLFVFFKENHDCSFVCLVEMSLSHSLILLSPEGTVVKKACSRRSHRRVPRHTSTRLRYFVARFQLENHSKSLRVVEVVEELGLITCGRIVYRQRARLFMAVTQGMFALALSTWKWEEKGKMKERHWKGQNREAFCMRMT